MLISLIVPVYNEELVIKESYQRFIAVFKNADIKNYELIFINDGSNDNTLYLLTQIAESDKNVKVISFSRNFGHQPAVTAGINKCKGDVAVIIDADLQDPPEVIPNMIKLHKDHGYNVVYGVRKRREGESKFKLLTAKLYYRILNSLSDIQFPVDTGDFRLIDRNVIDTFNGFNEKNKYIRGLISWMGFNQAPLYYEREARFAGETKYPLKKMIKFASIGVFYFSKKPLRLAITLGFFSILIGIALLVWLFINKIFNPEQIVSGWTSTITIIIFFGGIQLLTVGVLGQYIGSLFDEAKNRPEYIIEQQINFFS